MEEQVKRGPGRPKQEDTLRKGHSSWKPASLNEFTDKEPGYRYRMVNKDPNNLAKKKQEGWETVSGIQSSQTSHEPPPNKIEYGKPLTSVNEGHDWILQRIPEDLAQGRDAYFNAETERRTAGLTAHIKNDLSKEGAGMHGDITISSRKGMQTI